MTQQWKLVPVEPTEEMVGAAFSLFGLRVPGYATGNDARRAIYAAMVNAAPTAPASAQDDAKDEQATFSLPPVATAFFTEKGEVAYTGIYDRTLKALEAVKTTRMGISAGSIDLYTNAPAPAAGDARAWQGLTDAERDGYVGELVDYGTDFVSPLYSVVESIEKRLREKNAASQQQEG